MVASLDVLRALEEQAREATRVLRRQSRLEHDAVHAAGRHRDDDLPAVRVQAEPTERWIGLVIGVCTRA
jgi:hypothetical protein